MRRTALYLLIVTFFSLVTLGCIDSIDKESADFPQYYKNLAQQCKQATTSQGCCLASVKAMESGGYLLADEGGCPSGFHGNMLRCIDTFRWCELAE